MNMKTSGSGGMVDADDKDSVRCSTIYPEKFSGWGSSRYDDDMCQMDDDDLMVGNTSMKFEFNDANKVITA